MNSHRVLERARRCALRETRQRCCHMVKLNTTCSHGEGSMSGCTTANWPCLSKAGPGRETAKDAVPRQAGTNGNHALVLFGLCSSRGNNEKRNGTETRPGHSGERPMKKDNSSACLCFGASDSTTPVTCVSPAPAKARWMVALY